MAQVSIRNLDEVVVSRLKRKAAMRGVSLEAYLRDQLVRIAQQSRAEIMAQIDAIRVQTRPWQAGGSTADDYVREGREERDAPKT